VIDSPGPYERMRRQVVRGVAWLLLVAAVLAGVIVWGRLSRGQVAFEDIDCNAPPGLSRSDFLGEVRYVSRLPARLPVADVETHAVLREAFQKHPWVLSVEAIEPQLPDRLRVQLTFRQPALAVKWKDALRVVDDRGVLLPSSASSLGLPEFAGTPNAPGPEGQAWPDDEVIRQASASRER
jgi:cell division septal protein FtsQ